LAPWQKLGNHQVDSLRAFAILLGTVSWSLGAVYSRVAKLPKSPALAAGLQLIVGGFLLVASGLLMGEGSRLQMDALSLRSILGLLYLIIFGSVITFTAYVWLLNMTSATRVATHTYVNPVIAVFLGWAIAGEPLSMQTFVATLIIVISVYLVLGRTGKEISPNPRPSLVRNAEKMGEKLLVSN
jgi:drug/metabolite transporter (DMT)-like permease